MLSQEYFAQLQQDAQSPAREHRAIAYERTGSVPLTKWRERGSHQLHGAWMAVCYPNANCSEVARVNTTVLISRVWTAKLPDDESSDVPIDSCRATAAEASKGPRSMAKST